MRLVSEKPIIAAELLSVVQPEPKQTDISMIPAYYSRFCNLRKIVDYDHRMLFTACILHIYQPVAFTNPNILSIKKIGIIRELTYSFSTEKANVSKIVRKTILWYKIYSEFSDQVKKIMEEMG